MPCGPTCLARLWSTSSCSHQHLFSKKISLHTSYMHWKVILSKARSYTHFTSFSWQNVFFIVTRWSISRSKDLVPRSRSSGLISPTSLTEMYFLPAEMLLGTMTYPDRDDDKLAWQVLNARDWTARCEKFFGSLCPTNNFASAKRRYILTRKMIDRGMHAEGQKTKSPKEKIQSKNAILSRIHDSRQTK